MATEQELGVREVDLTGEVCPMTFVKAKLHLDAIAVGDALTLTLKAGEQIRNVPRSLRDEGHRIEAVRREGDRYHLLVRKGE
ncbi:MAG: sulfurtransferase TusA family protein [Armatimonadetes bacterium]|nr:sulfurtransferase TusA family protein [Armatimonadota bacterium]